jgi:hypothetical protein
MTDPFDKLPPPDERSYVEPSEQLILSVLRTEAFEKSMSEDYKDDPRQRTAKRTGVSKERVIEVEKVWREQPA